MSIFGALSHFGVGQFRDPSFPGGSSINDPRQLALNNMFSSGKMDPSSFYAANPQIQAQQAQQALYSSMAMGGLANNIASQQALGKPTQALDPSAIMAGQNYLSPQALKQFAPIMNQMGPLSWLKPGMNAADPNANPMGWLSRPPSPMGGAKPPPMPSLGLLGQK